MALEEKLKRLEEECKQREAERVSLELELTEVKESLKKALAGGVTLGLAIEPRSGTSSPQVSVPKAQHREVPHGLSGSFLTTVGGAQCVETLTSVFTRVFKGGGHGCLLHG